MKKVTQMIGTPRKPQPVQSLWSRFRYSIKDKLPYLMVFFILLLSTLVLVFNRVIVYVDAGEGGVLFKPFQNGTVIDITYDEGVHAINPFNTITIYNLRTQIMFHQFDVLTNNGLTVNLKLAIRYKPVSEYLGLLHQSFGPDYPNKIILPNIESVLRKGLGSQSPEAIYTNKNMLLTNLIADAINEISRNYVIVDDIFIREVKLPDEIRQAIEQKLKQEQTYLSYSFKIQAEQKEADRKRIESAGIRDYAANISSTMSKDVLTWQGIQASLELARSNNAKIVVFGGGANQLPLLFNADNPSRPEVAPVTPIKPEKEMTIISNDPSRGLK